MRVLVWSSTFPPPTDDGTAVFVQHVCNELIRKGHQVQVVTPWRGKRAVEHDRGLPYRIARYPTPPRLSLVVLNVCLLFHMLRLRPDLILMGHAISSGALSMMWLSKRLSVPYVVLIHGSDLSYSVSIRPDRWVLDRLLSNAALLLTNSRFTEAKLQRHGHGRRGVFVLHPGVDTDFFQPGDGSAVRELYGLNGKKVCLSVGRVAPRKGHARVMEALPQVLRHLPNVTYLIAGRGSEEESLRILSTELGLTDHVRFLGFVEEAWLPAVYNVCDLLVLPAHTTQNDVEGFGIVYSEAAACGVPVIGGRGGGVPEAVLDGITGLLVDPYDVDALAAAMIRLLTDEALASRLGANARQRVETELSWEKVGEKLDAILKQVVEASKQAR